MNESKMTASEDYITTQHIPRMVYAVLLIPRSAGRFLVLFVDTKRISIYLRRLAARSVFFISEMMVIGPTPPGTGVIYEHLGATSA